MAMEKPVPICKIAREQGCEVPMSCLFGCPHNCADEQRAADNAECEAKRAREIADDFPDLTQSKWA